VLSTNGDTFSAAEDFDQRLIDYIVTEFKKEQGRRPEERRTGPAASQGSGGKGPDRAVLFHQTEINCPTSRRNARGRNI